MPLDLAKTETLAALAQCPRCEGKLESAASSLKCTACGATFAPLHGVPALLADAEGAMGRWRSDLARFHEMMHQTRAGLEADLGRFDLLPSVRSRLSRTLEANTHNTAHLTELFERGGIRGAMPIRPGDSESSDEPRPGVALVEHFEQLIRDWGWDAEGGLENTVARDRVVAALGSSSRDLGRTLVLGAGACRLAYDLAQTLEPKVMVALDLDPLMLLVAHEVLFGQGVDLMETPIDPASQAQVAVLRQLRRPGPMPSNITLLLADAFDPPFPAGTFDTLITPWFIDVASEDIREVFAVASHLLAPGGRWINQGPLLYPSRSFARRHTKEEVLELLTMSGFNVAHASTVQTIYLQSPASGHARLENVFSFVASKDAEVASAIAGTDTPVWILLPHLPVPAFAGLAEFRAVHPAFQHVQAIVDGHRSLADIAHELESHVQIPAHLSPVDVAGALLLNVYQQVLALRAGG